jgi:hypothetical protein
MQYFRNFVPGEKNILTFDMSDGLKNGNLLQGMPTVQITVYSGTDPNPNEILNGEPEIDSTQTLVLVPIAVEIDQVIYQITAFCGTSNSEILLGYPGRLPVNSNNPSSEN